MWYKSILFNGVPMPMHNADTGGAGGTGDNGGNDDPNAGSGGNSSTGDDNKPFAIFPDAESFNARVSREAKKIMNTQLKELGYDKVEDLKTSLEGFKNVQTEYDTAKSTYTTSEEGYKNSIAQANERLMKYEVKLQAMALDIVDADAAYALMDKTNLQVSDDGSISGVKEALDILIADKQYLIRNRGTAQGGHDFSSGNNDTPVLTMDSIKAMSQAEVSSRLTEINEFLSRNK